MIVRVALESYADDEVKRVNGYQDQITATPLAQWLEGRQEVEDGVQRSMVKGGYPIVPRMLQLAQAMVEVQTAVDYFQLLSLAHNDPTMTKRTDSLKEVETLSRLAAIGLAKGVVFDPETLDPSVKSALEAGFEAGKEEVKTAVREGLTPMNGWMVTKDMGNFGTDYLTRAAIADARWAGREVAPRRLLLRRCRWPAAQRSEGVHADVRCRQSASVHRVLADSVVRHRGLLHSQRDRPLHP